MDKRYHGRAVYKIVAIPFFFLILIHFDTEATNCIVPGLHIVGFPSQLDPSLSASGYTAENPAVIIPLLIAITPPLKLCRM